MPSDRILLRSPINLLLLSLLALSSCHGQDRNPQGSPDDTLENGTGQSLQQHVDPFDGLNMEAQIMQVVRRVHQDARGNLWFTGDGVFCYDGDSLFNFSDHEIFSRTVVRQIIDDGEGNIWFGTHHGIARVEIPADIKSGLNVFEVFTSENGLVDNDVWSMEVDANGDVWIGTLDGVCRFDGKSFSPFLLPEAEPDPTRGVTSAKIVHCITEDSKGNIWFGTNGGTYIYDGASLSSLTEADGLCSNAVNAILEDKHGHTWFATHHNGVCRWDGKSFTYFSSEDGIHGTEAWSLYEDRSGNIWFPIENAGVYRYDGTRFTNFHKRDGLKLNAVHSVIEDHNGTLWLGGFGGLYRSGNRQARTYVTDKTAGPNLLFLNVTKEGPWPE